MIHFKTHPDPVSGCFGCKIVTVQLNAGAFTREREGRGPGFSDEGTRSYVRSMYAQRRAAGLPDPVAENAESAKFAPAAGVNRSKKYKAVNGGL